MKCPSKKTIKIKREHIKEVKDIMNSFELLAAFVDGYAFVKPTEGNEAGRVYMLSTTPARRVLKTTLVNAIIV